jgi:hypothetical protein
MDQNLNCIETDLSKKQLKHEIKANIRNLKLIIDDLDSIEIEKRDKLKKDFEFSIEALKKDFSSYVKN